jgi:hypothetical protein
VGDKNMRKRTKRIIELMTKAHRLGYNEGWRELRYKIAMEFGEQGVSNKAHDILEKIATKDGTKWGIEWLNFGTPWWIDVNKKSWPYEFFERHMKRDGLKWFFRKKKSRANK